MTTQVTRPRLRPQVGVLALLTAIAGIMLPPAGAGADTIDTFTFTQVGWQEFGPYGGAAPTLQLSGTFTGRVDASGHLQLSDLTAFSASFDLVGLGSFVTAELDQVTFFSFGSTGGASSLTFVTPDLPSATFVPVRICVGAAAVLHPDCTGLGLPAETKGSVSQQLRRYYTTSLPDVRLVSSVPADPIGPGPGDPGPITTVPEPGSLMLAGSGVLALMAKYRRGRMPR